MAENSPTAWVDAACDRLEQGWKAGSPPAVEELMADCPPDARRHALAELVALDQEYRTKAGRPLGRDEAFARFGGLGPWAEQVLNWAFPLPPVVAVAVTAGPHAGERFELTGHDSYTVGRQPGLSVSLPKDGKVSRVHLLVAVVGGTVRVIDAGSKGGTFVGGNRVPQCDLPFSGAVRLGSDTELTLTLVGSDYGSTVEFGPAAGGVTVAPAGPPGIPGYDLGDELGRGAMGAVYRAVRRATGEAVAVKTILPSVAPTRLMIGRFCREAELLAKLSHPNVVGFRESGAAGSVLFVAMEFVPGRSGAEVMRQSGPLPPARVLRWADQLLAGLHHAHAAKIVHRDVKPANLMVSEAAGGEAVKVADFGLARAMESSGLSGLTVDGSTCGTLAYMPPEQITDVKRVGAAADQYAAAATLYHLLTGGPVYPPTRKASELIGLILSDDPLPLRAGADPLPEPFGRVLHKALARDPATRYPSCDAMRQDLLRR